MISRALAWWRTLRLGLLSRGRNTYFRALGVRIKGHAWIQQVEIPRAFHAIELGEGVALDRGVTLLADERSEGVVIRIGARTYVNRNTFVDAVTLVSIGEDCAIGPGCYITDHDHGRELGRPPLQQPLVAQPTTIEDRVWVGANATILKGVTVGADAVVAAGSVVTHDVPAGGVVGGIPARHLKGVHVQ